MPYHIAWLIIGHLFSDFICQSRKMATLKSMSPQWLLRHGMVQYVTFFAITLFFFHSYREAAGFAGINALIHCAIDWHIWKGYKMILCWRLFDKCCVQDMTAGELCVFKKFEYWNDYWFYTFIGVDQCLHALTLILLYQAFV